MEDNGKRQGTTKAQSPDETPSPSRPAEAPEHLACVPLVPSSPRRWWLAVVITSVVSVPIGILLSFAAALPFFLGVFFFALFGLGIGAIANRIAARSRPYSPWMLLLGTTVIVLGVYAVSIHAEARGFPTDVAKRVQSSLRSLPADSPEAFRAQVAANIRTYFKEAYPPGGTFGYIRWVLTNGELKPARVHGMKRPLKAPQRQVMWAIRVMLSITLLAFGIASQTLTLKLEREPSSRAIDRNEPTAPGDEE